MRPGADETPRSRVFQPFRIGRVSLRNRVFVSAHTTNLGEKFLPTARHVGYHAERARGGAGLIILEPLRVHETSLGRAGGISASREALPVLSDIVRAVRSEGAAVFTQITHAGRHSENAFQRVAAWGPTARPFHETGHIPHAMGPRDMGEVRAAYVNAAKLAVEAGFQGVEIHFGHGHLLHQFISPHSNDRSDEYGGSEENRWRFPMEVLAEVIDAVEGRAVVGVRMSADELVEGGQDLEAGRRLARRLDSTAGVDYLNVSIASYTVPSIGHHVADMSEGHLPYIDTALAIADECARVPVLAACRAVDIEDAERALADGRIAAVAMTRAHIADPHLVRKAVEGRAHEIRPCVSCNFCIDEIAKHRPITCMMNPVVGRELEWSAEPPQTVSPRHVLVVGGGAAGMEAARVAAERGHRVQLWEAARELGGQLVTGRRGAGRGELDRLRIYEEGRLRALGVKVRTGHTATVEAIKAERPDVVVVATGARRRNVRVPGWGRPLGVAEALTPQSWSGRGLLIVDREGGWATSSVAETAARGGAKVHLVTEALTPLWKVTEYSRMTAVERLRRLDVSIWPASTAEFVDGLVTVRPAMAPGSSPVEGITDVIVVEPPAASDGLADRLWAAGVPVHPVGDAVAPRSLLDAMFEGHALAREL